MISKLATFRCFITLERKPHTDLGLLVNNNLTCAQGANFGQTDKFWGDREIASGRPFRVCRARFGAPGAFSGPFFWTNGQLEAQASNSTNVLTVSGLEKLPRVSGFTPEDDASAATRAARAARA